MRRSFEVFYGGWDACATRRACLTPDHYVETDRVLWRRGYAARQTYEQALLDSSELFKDLIVREDG
jgi:hypothetical protein